MVNAGKPDEDQESDFAVSETTEPREESVISEDPSAQTRVADQPVPRDGVRYWVIMPVILAATFMVALDFFIVNVAIPSTQHELNADPASIQLVIAGYWLALAAGLITCGRLGDLVGRRRMFVIGLTLFVITSAGCGVAPTAGFLVVARILQGLSAAAMMPQGLAILGIVYTGAHRARAFTAYAMTLGVASVCGQLLGGVLINADIAGLSWRSCYLVNVPIGLITLVLALRYVPESRAEGRSKLDLVGTALVGLGLIAFVWPLVNGQEAGWPLWTWLMIALSVVLLGGFFRYQAKLTANGGAPLIDTRFFRERAFTFGLLATVLFNMLMGSFFLFLAIYLQEGRGMAALDSGLIFTPIAIGYFLASLVAEPIAARIGRHVLWIGALGMAAGLVWVKLVLDDVGRFGSASAFIPAFALAGVGMGLVMAPLTNLVLAGIRPEYAGAASGVLATSQQVGGAVGVAVVGVVFYGGLTNRADPGAYPPAFSSSIVWLVGFAVLIGVLVQFLPRRRAAA